MCVLHIEWNACVCATHRMECIRACCHFSCVQLFATIRAIAYQAPLSAGFTRQEYWSGLPFPSPGDVPDPGIEPVSPGLAGRFFTIEPSGKPGHRVSSYYYYGSSYICSSSHARAAHKSRRQESRTGNTRYAGWLDGGPVAVGS